MKRLWVAPFVLAGVVTIVAILFTGLVYRGRASSQQVAAAEVRHVVADALRARLDADRQFLVVLASQIASDTDRSLFEARVDDYAAGHPGLTNVTFSDTGFVIRWTAPYEPNKQVIGLPLDLPEPHRASRAALATRLPVYTNAFQVVQGYDALEVYVPVFAGDRFVGVLGGIYRLDRLLATVAPADLGERRRVELESGGRTVAAAGGSRSGAPASVSEHVGVTGTDLSVVAYDSETDPNLMWAVTLAALATALAFGVAWGLWRYRVEAVQRGRADRALVENAALLDTLLASTTDAVYAKDLDGRYILFNRAASEVVGTTPEAAIGRDDSELFPPESAAEIRALDLRIMREGHPSTVEEHVTTPDGERRVFLTTKGPLRDPSGEVIGLFGIARDVTDLKQAESELHERSERLRMALDLTRQGVWDYDVLTDRLVRSPAYAAMIGADPRTFSETTDEWRERIHPDDRADALAAFTACLEGETDAYRAEYRLRRVDGTYVWLSVVGAVAERDAEGTPLRMIGTYMDVTERVAAAEELQRAELRFRQTLDSMMEGAQIVGFDWSYLYANDAFVKQSKYNRDEIMAGTVLGLYPGIEQTPVYAAYRTCFDERIPVRMENEFRFPDGSVGWFELLFQPVPEGIFILSNEITDRKRDEQELKEKNRELERVQEELSALNSELEERVRTRTAELASANKELEAFAYSVSHDLRAPLRHVTGFAELLVSHSRDTLDEAGRHYVDVISESAVRMGRLIDDLLRFSHIGRVEMRLGDVDMNAAVREAMAEIAPQAEGRDIEWTIADLPTVQGDPTLLRQVWVNLLGNAVKYTARQPVAHIRLGVSAEDGEYVFSVRDDGVGFDPAFADQLFRVFQRLHSADEFEGTGIGLANVGRIVTRLGGRVWAESIQGQGAAFYFTLPRDGGARS